MKQARVVIRGMSAFEAQRQEELLKQIRVEDRNSEYIIIYPFREDSSQYVTLRKPSKHPAGFLQPSQIHPGQEKYWYAADAERLGLALQQAAELARVLDAKFKEEHGIP